jgi:phage-related protein
MKPLYWIGQSLKDVKNFPSEVRQEVGYAIHLAQKGDKAPTAVPMVGFGSAKVLEVVISNDGDAFRAVYTIKFAKAVYVLHAFQKKSPRGSKTPKPDITTIRSRLKQAEEDYYETYRSISRERENERGA